MTGDALIGGAVGGAVMGSAAGAALERWPAGATLRRPRRSSCPHCRTVLRGRDLIPVLSWLLLRGCCRHCSVAIDVRLPLLEAASAIGVALTLHVHGVSGRSALLAVGVVAVLLATCTDLERMIVPDRLTLPLGVLALTGMAILAAGDAAGDVRGLIVWALGVPCALHIVSWVTRWLTATRPLGGGDIKLLVGVLALASAVEDGPAALLILAVVGAASVAVVGIVTGRLERSDRIPFAPAIAGGYLTVVLAPTLAAPVAALLGGAP